MVGFYCPSTVANDSSTIPVYCPPSIDCLVLRLLGVPCVDGQNGSQGIYEPISCKMGCNVGTYIDYCPTPMEMYRCPENSYCLTGTATPIKCDYLSYCPEGAIYQRPYYGLLLCLVVDLLLFAIYWKKSNHRIANLKFKKISKVKGEIQKAFERNVKGLKVRLDFKMEGLSLNLPNGENVLNDISGYIRASKITAVMGPSGSGKTTFLNVLAGKIKRTSGKLYVSGREIEMSKFKNFVGFVPQEDIMHRDMTVRENIAYSAKIRLPAGWKSPEVEDHVDNVLELLKLSHVANSIVGDETTRGISGGQRKRVNIGMELVACPLCLFLDEPTSGLDATSALEVMEVLADLTDMGMTVMAVIHQPRTEIFYKFDECLLIVPGGKAAYLGPTKDAKSYFKGMGFQFPLGVNEADILMEILGNRGVNDEYYNYKDLCTQWALKETSNKDGTNQTCATEHTKRQSLVEDEALYNQFHSFTRTSFQKTSFFSQFYHCHLFSLKKQLRNSTSLFLELFVTTACAAIIGAQGNTSYDKYIGLYKGSFVNLPNPIILWGTPVVFQAIGMAVAISAAIPVRLFNIRA
ncbi:hypothetical protein HDV01_005292 [Terramyces sp. JEL0728]|nr:hypothetical protein HDV01_005292 [Terramyces sp. JEL0728]